MTEREFLQQQQKAIERMKELKLKSQIPNNSQHKMPPVPSFVKMPENGNIITNTNQIINNKVSDYKNENCEIKKENNNKNSLNIPFLESIFKDSDSTLIIGLLLILMSENSDKILLFALIYILL